MAKITMDQGPEPRQDRIFIRTSLGLVGRTCEIWCLQEEELSLSAARALISMVHQTELCGVETESDRERQFMSKAGEKGLFLLDDIRSVTPSVAFPPIKDVDVSPVSCALPMGDADAARVMTAMAGPGGHRAEYQFENAPKSLPDHYELRITFAS